MRGYGKDNPPNTDHKFTALVPVSRGPHCSSATEPLPSPWPPATTHGRYRLGSVTRTSSTPCVTPSWLLIGLRTSGAENLSSRCRLEPVPYGLNRNACDHVRASSMIPSLSGS